ncbi:MAG TPA: hypothetical protein EYG70_04760 [Sulfurimonas sp.]|nr:hypothetical protein [Sulfurimonas sp.]
MNFSLFTRELHSHYNTWHLGAATYFGKRVFAIMNDGFKLQHHAMEFDLELETSIGSFLLIV